MISSKNQKNITNVNMTPTERKEKIAKLRKEHEDYFQTIDEIDALYMPKMAYRPSGKDDLHISFFPSELEKGGEIYTEFVSIAYDSEDPKRTLYLYKYNPHWKEEYELVTSNSGFERHLIPVNELRIINDVTSRGKVASILKIDDLPNPDDIAKNDQEWLKRIAIALESIAKSINK
ncbi:unnamed protein product [marine sediment metagenome]|uniref:Uncharacterized protein n=1 Tax=marine sediment metagenome TaxID=412755 RepID=X0SGN4_9ZZZZ